MLPVKSEKRWEEECAFSEYVTLYRAGCSSGLPGSGLPKPLLFIDQLPSFDETNLVRLFRFVQCNMYMVSMHLPHGSDKASAINSYIHFDANKLMIN